MSTLHENDPSFPKLSHVAHIRFELGDTVSAGETPKGNYVYVPIIGGHFNATDYVPKGAPATEPLLAKILPGGSDYARINNDGSFSMEVSTAAQGINVPNLFYISSSGYMGPDLDHGRDHETTFGQLDGWHSIRVNTDSVEYGWLNTSLLFGQERLVIKDGMARVVELRVFRVEVQR